MPRAPTTPKGPASNIEQRAWNVVSSIVFIDLYVYWHKLKFFFVFCLQFICLESSFRWQKTFAWTGFYLVWWWFCVESLESKIAMGYRTRSHRFWWLMFGCAIFGREMLDCILVRQLDWLWFCFKRMWILFKDMSVQNLFQLNPKSGQPNETLFVTVQSDECCMQFSGNQYMDCEVIRVDSVFLHFLLWLIVIKV